LHGESDVFVTPEKKKALKGRLRGAGKRDDLLTYNAPGKKGRLRTIRRCWVMPKQHRGGAALQRQDRGENTGQESTPIPWGKSWVGGMDRYGKGERG